MYAPADEPTRARMEAALAHGAVPLGTGPGQGPLAWGWQGCTIGCRTGTHWLGVASGKGTRPPSPNPAKASSEPSSSSLPKYPARTCTATSGGRPTGTSTRPSGPTGSPPPSSPRTAPTPPTTPACYHRRPADDPGLGTLGGRSRRLRRRHPARGQPRRPRRRGEGPRGLLRRAGHRDRAEWGSCARSPKCSRPSPPATTPTPLPL